MVYSGHVVRFLTVEESAHKMVRKNSVPVPAQEADGEALQKISRRSNEDIVGFLDQAGSLDHVTVDEKTLNHAERRS